MSDRNYSPRAGETCQYKDKGSSNWCLCKIIAYHEDKVWIENFAVGSNPVKRVYSVEFKPVAGEESVKPAVISEAQAKIITDELIPMIVADVMPLIERVLAKRLNLFAAEIIKFKRGG